MPSGRIVVLPNARNRPCRGDADCDGTVNVFDIDPFVMALTDLPAYTAQYGCAANADCNCDGAVNVFDIDAFVSCMIGECPIARDRGLNPHRRPALGRRR